MVKLTINTVNAVKPGPQDIIVRDDEVTGDEALKRMVDLTRVVLSAKHPAPNPATKPK